MAWCLHPRLWFIGDTADVVERAMKANELCWALGIQVFEVQEQYSGKKTGKFAWVELEHSDIGAYLAGNLDYPRPQFETRVEAIKNALRHVQPRLLALLQEFTGDEAILPVAAAETQEPEPRCMRSASRQSSR